MTTRISILINQRFKQPKVQVPTHLVPAYTVQCDSIETAMRCMTIIQEEEAKRGDVHQPQGHDQGRVARAQRDEDRPPVVDAQGRQQYRHFPVLQLALFTLELLRVVWKMPPYRRLPSSRRLLQAQQGSLFERFAR